MNPVLWPRPWRKVEGPAILDAHGNLVQHGIGSPDPAVLDFIVQLANEKHDEEYCWQ